MSQIQQYLECALTCIKQHGQDNWKDVEIKSMPQYLLQHGRPFTVNPAVKWKGKPRKMKECYCNAINVMLNPPILNGFDDRLIYCEGYAIPAGIPIPIEHGFCVNSFGEVIDPTWKEPGIEYFGVPFKHQFVLQRMRETEVYGIFDWRWMPELVEIPPHEFMHPAFLSAKSANSD